MWTLDEIIEAVRGIPYRIERKEFTGISIDSRAIAEGELFVPIKGKNFDGHDFIDKAYKRSGGGALCERKMVDIFRNAKGTIILVDDTSDALLSLAKYKRQRLKSKFICITGSNGKTTTKELLVELMRPTFSIHYNEKNYNNIIGVPLSILSIKGEPSFCIFELGTNNKGEIERLADITMPEISAVTNINPAHLEGLFELEGIIEEKCSLFRHTKEGGVILINADSINVNYLVDKAHKAYTFGIENPADFRLIIERELGWDGFEIRLKLIDDEVLTQTRLIGKHNLYNILTASALAKLAGLDKDQIAERLPHFLPFDRRFLPIHSEKGYLIIDDTYNANPASMEWAIRTLSSLPCDGRRYVVLGAMKELGAKTSYYHRELGRLIKESGIDLAILIGDSMEDAFEEAGPEKAIFFETKEEIIELLLNTLKKGDSILVKGSRAMNMEDIVEAIR